MWVLRGIPASLKSLGSELSTDLASEEVEESVSTTTGASASITAGSVISRSSYLERTKRPGDLDISYRKARLPQQRQRQSIINEPLWLPREQPDVCEQLAERDERVKELEHSFRVQREELLKVQKEFKEISLKYRVESKEWNLRHEDYLTQTHRLTERIEAYDRDLNDMERMQQYQDDIIHGELDSDDGMNLPPAPNNYYHGSSDDDNDEHDDALTTKSAQSNFSLPSWMGNNKKRPQHQHQQNEEYMEILQTKLLNAKHRMLVMNNQCEMLEETLEEETKILRQKLKLQDEELCRTEQTLTEQLREAEYHHKNFEQLLLAKLQAKEERIARLEDLVDELRDAAEKKARGALNLEEFASITTLHSMKEAFDVLSKKKDAIEMELGRQNKFLKGELKRLRTDKEKQGKLIDRFEFGDTLTALELEATATRNGDDDDDDDDNDDEDVHHSIFVAESSRIEMRFQDSKQSVLSTRSLDDTLKSYTTDQPPNRSKSADSSIVQPFELDDNLDDLMDSMLMRGEASSSVEEPNQSFRRRPEHPVESEKFRKQTMRVLENKWSTMDDDLREKQQRRMTRFL